MTHTPAEKHTNQSGGKFHWLFLKEAEGRRETYDKPLWETANFVVLPSLGSIVPGWLLIVPRFPVARMADVPTALESELNDLIDRMMYITESRFSKSYIFEHGGYAGSKVSCGVDQAHLHLAPLDFDFIFAARADQSLRWQHLDGGNLPNSIEYLGEYLYMSSRNESFFAQVTVPVSQWFRKLIAKHAGCPDSWDYNQFRFEENVLETLRRVGVHD